MQWIWWGIAGLGLSERSVSGSNGSSCTVSVEGWPERRHSRVPSRAADLEPFVEKPLQSISRDRDVEASNAFK